MAAVAERTMEASQVRDIVDLTIELSICLATYLAVICYVLIARCRYRRNCKMPRFLLDIGTSVPIFWSHSMRVEGRNRIYPGSVSMKGMRTKSVNTWNTKGD